MTDCALFKIVLQAIPNHFLTSQINVACVHLAMYCSYLQTPEIDWCGYKYSYLNVRAWHSNTLVTYWCDVLICADRLLNDSFQLRLNNSKIQKRYRHVCESGRYWKELDAQLFLCLAHIQHLLRRARSARQNAVLWKTVLQTFSVKSAWNIIIIGLCLSRQFRSDSQLKVRGCTSIHVWLHIFYILNQIN